MIAAAGFTHVSLSVRAEYSGIDTDEAFIDWPALCGKLRAAGYGHRVLMEVMMAHSPCKVTAAFLDASHEAAVHTWNALRTAASCRWQRTPDEPR